MVTYIYALKCPISGEIRYIGKANNPAKRRHCHISAARLGHRDHHTARWIRTLLTQSLAPVLQILLAVPDSEDWRDHERRIIDELRAQGCRLTNQTIGGEGVSLIEASDRERFRQAVKATWTPERLAGWSEISKARWTPDMRRASAERMRTQANTRWSDPDNRQKQSEITRNHMLGGRAKKMAEIQKSDSAYRDKQAARTATYWADPENRRAAAERMRARNKERWSNEANRAALAESMRGGRAKKMTEAYWIDPSNRDAHSKRLRASWKARRLK